MEVSIKSSSLMSNSTCFSASQCKNCIMWLPPPLIMCFRNRKRYCAPSASPSSLASFAMALSSPYSRVHLHPFPPPSLRPRLAIAIQLHSANRGLATEEQHQEVTLPSSAAGLALAAPTTASIVATAAA